MKIRADLLSAVSFVMKTVDHQCTPVLLSQQASQTLTKVVETVLRAKTAHWHLHFGDQRPRKLAVLACTWAPWQLHWHWRPATHSPDSLTRLAQSAVSSEFCWPALDLAAVWGGRLSTGTRVLGYLCTILSDYSCTYYSGTRVLTRVLLSTMVLEYL